MKRRLIFLIIATLLLPKGTYGQCPNAVDLKVGATVTDCARVGLRTDYAQGIQKELIEGDYNKKIVDEQKKLIELKDLAIQNTTDQAKVWKDEATRERQVADEEQAATRKDWWVGFACGVAVLLGGAWTVKQVAR